MSTTDHTPTPTAEQVAEALDSLSRSYRTDDLDRHYRETAERVEVLRAALVAAPATSAGFTLDDLDRLRAELAETRRVGDAVAGVVDSLLTYDPAYAAQEKHANEIVAAWRSVRGDAPAPAEPPATDCVHPLSAGSGECVRKDYCGSGGSCQPVELPVTLSSVDDVAAVCSFLNMSQVRERTWYCNPQVTVWAAGTCDEGTGGVEIDSVPLYLDVQFPAATSLVVAAIEAARGGAR